MFARSIPAKVKRLERQVLDLEADLDAKDRTIAVMQAELDSLAAVIARDRERIRAEGSAYARQRAESEGSDEHIDARTSGR